MHANTIAAKWVLECVGWLATSVAYLGTDARVLEYYQTQCSFGHVISFANFIVAIG
jgi:hypothetical protein